MPYVYALGWAPLTFAREMGVRRKRHDLEQSDKINPTWFPQYVSNMCFDMFLSLGRCNREKPPCKYFHPPQHLKDQLLINGRNHLALKNALMQQMGISPGQPVLPGQVPAVNGGTVATTVATAVPPAAAAALGFTLAWGTAPPPPYTTYVVSHSPSAAVVTHHNGNAPPTNGVPHCNGTVSNGSSGNTTTNSHSSATVNGHSNHSAPSNNNNSNHCSNNNNNSTTTNCKATNPYLASMPASTYSPYFQPGHLVPTLLGPVSDPSSVSQLGPVVQQAVVSTQQKIPRSDRLEVCREFMRGACKRAESECRFAHPQESVTTHEDGSVTVCMDAVKGRCAREPCRYFHPPLHLQAQIKAAQSRATATAPVSAAAAVAAAAAAAAATMGPLQPPPPPPGAVTSTSQLSLSGGQSPLEVGKKRAADNDMIQMMDMKTMGSIYYENFAFPGMVPFKRTAGEKSGIPVYQPGATYQQLMQLQQPFVPVSCEYPSTSTSVTAATYIPPTSTATPIANSLASLGSSSSSSGGAFAAALAAASSASSYASTSMLHGGLYYSTSGVGGSNAIVTSVGAGGGGGWAGSNTSVASMLNHANNNNSPKVGNKNAPLTKSMSLQSMASLGGSMTHLASTNGGAGSLVKPEGGGEHKESSSGGTEQDDAHAGDLLTPSSGALSSGSTTTTTSSGSGSSLAQSLATSSTQAITVPVTSPLLQFSAAATSVANHMNHQASVQAHFQAAHAAAAHQAAAAQAAANHNAAYAAAAAAASAQYPGAAAAGAHYADAASMAKEVAQKNYALKLHGGSSALTGKPLTALGYTLNKGGLLPQPGQQYAAAAAAAAAASASNAATAAAYPQAAARLTSPAVAVAAATPQQALLAPALTTRPPPPIMPQAGAYPQLLRPQMPAGYGTNPYAAAAVAQQQLMNQGFMYPTAAFSAAAGGYPFQMAQAGMPSGLTGMPTPVPQVSAAQAAAAAASTVVLNPYKKMKTS
ncbi:mucin-19-like [Anopheles ziemanni]|uniref:mucin-19-like n=1 Tax=Anopheles ziemanni TaxID=345580 RepID=UPI002660390C|nr:mucin-19-like [Anopheles ziemanni]